MRWGEKSSPCEGQHRIIIKFLWWPRKIMGETRWLERAVFCQRYKKVEVPGEFLTHKVLQWVDEYWVDYP